MLLFRYDNEFTYNRMSQHLLLDFFLFFVFGLHVKIMREEEEKEEKKTEKYKVIFNFSSIVSWRVCLCAKRKTEYLE